MLYAQRQYDNWYFGTYLGMRFNAGSMNIILNGSNAMYARYGSSTYSDPVTGEVMLYTNGSYVFNRQHLQMPNGDFLDNDANSMHTVIVPHPGDPSQYFIFSTNTGERKLYYSIVDMKGDGGLGTVISKANVLNTNADAQFCVVRQLYDQGYWLIMHGYHTDQFMCYRIGRSGIYMQPAVSKAGSIAPEWNSYPQGKMISSNDGQELLLCSGSVNGTCSTELFRFDKRCGTVSLQTVLHPPILQADAILAYGAFSRNNKLVYISYCYNSGQNFLIQYDLSSPEPDQSKYIVGGMTIGFADLQLAPDDRIYVTSADNGSVTSKISVIRQPDKPGAACDFRFQEYELSSNVSHYTEHFPEMIMDFSSTVPGYEKPQYTVRNFCLGDTTLFTLKKNIQADSARWYFGNDSIAGFAAGYRFAGSGSKQVRFRWYQCTIPLEDTLTIEIGSKPDAALGNDTALCNGSTVVLSVPAGAKSYHWSTGDSLNAILVQRPGTYSVKVNNGDCSAEDTVQIAYYPQLWLALGDEYFICDKESELVKLDAGEGFQHYQWYPTGDTTQWIDVAEVKDYFVVVKDFRGCDGKDGTTVKRRCPVAVFFPNAFTPNDDGVNDVYAPIGTDVTQFTMRIYNRWGEQVFFTDKIGRTWDGTMNGKHAPDDVYVFKASYSGYFNKRLKDFEAKGNISLFR